MWKIKKKPTTTMVVILKRHNQYTTLTWAEQ